MEYIALSFNASGASLDALEGFFLTHTQLAGTEERGFETTVFFISKSEWNTELENRLKTFCTGSSEIEFLGVELLEDKNWNAEWEASVQPIRITTDLVIAPSWKLDVAKAIGSKYLIQIDPKMSFGTGHHETTRLCLQAIEQMEVGNCAVLDLGTGSGILALYALLRGTKKAIGIDTDMWSIENARENRALNGFSEAQFEIRMGTLDCVSSQEYFDLILANIHRNVLLEISSQLFDHISVSGHLILSGILEYDAEEIREMYEESGFTFVRELKENEWSALVFQRTQ